MASPDLGRFFAHSLPSRPIEEWEPLETHLEQVAALAASHAECFGAAAWGRVAGLWHDLGKYRMEFQRRIRGAREQAPHAGVGAALAAERQLIPLAFVIAGHHSGLANPQTQGAGVTPLIDRVEEARPVLAAVLPVIPENLLIPGLRLDLPDWARVTRDTPREEQEQAARSVEFWVRMLFSALVDADFLATERFCSRRTGAIRRGTPDLAPLAQRLEERLAGFRADSEVNGVRRAVLEACLTAEERRPGLFSLTVPTGGGKTLSSMAFALRHAVRYGLRRVVVAIPFTSIIEQNARVYREIFGADHVVEHHSNLDEESLLELDGETETARRLASENWDAPVIVTTNVQLFESLFSNRPSRCRKLHNLTQSVIILDEAQALPAGLLLPALDALKELVGQYGCTVLLTTATQPALTRRPSLPQGLAGVEEIIHDPSGLARELSRVQARWPAPGDGPVSFEELAGRIGREHQVLAIVHRRQDARELCALLPEPGRYHLSALMCPAHRHQVLARVREALRKKAMVHLVTTQLVEAGVDIDFPVVFRALAGLDSLVQAAGRCNREGALRNADGSPALGRFEVFQAPSEPPPGILRRGLEATNAMLVRYPGGLPFGDPDVTEEYFRMLYSAVNLDARGVQSHRTALNFANTAEAFQVIENATWPVVVPWGDDASTRLARHATHPSRDTFRSLQPLTVQIYDQQLGNLRQAGAVEEVGKGLFALVESFRHLYHAEFGLLGGEGALPDPKTLIT